MTTNCSVSRIDRRGAGTGTGDSGSIEKRRRVLRESALCLDAETDSDHVSEEAEVVWEEEQDRYEDAEVEMQVSVGRN